MHNPKINKFRTTHREASSKDTSMWLCAHSVSSCSCRTSPWRRKSNDKCVLYSESIRISTKMRIWALEDEQRGSGVGGRSTWAIRCPLNWKHTWSWLCVLAFTREGWNIQGSRGRSLKWPVTKVTLLTRYRHHIWRDKHPIQKYGYVLTHIEGLNAKNCAVKAVHRMKPLLTNNMEYSGSTECNKEVWMSILQYTMCQ